MHLNLNKKQEIVVVNKGKKPFMEKQKMIMQSINMNCWNLKEGLDLSKAFLLAHSTHFQYNPSVNRV